MKVTKCVCSNIEFSELKKISMDLSISDVNTLSDELHVAKNCRLCVPYISEMLRTGHTEFAPIITREDEDT
jgi:bacterioferritin-associated ferredoxin